MRKPIYSREERAICASLYAITVEVKSQFIKNLPVNMAIADKRSRISTLEKACSEVLRMSPDRFFVDY
ncbi:hypothetical protein [Thalassotalea eurytherma]|uniref:Uncharacterized protein n=1 Tax=Thalassotalea eurytherma TaxID=1144278 RepID=A0ABQ6H3I8_9GAMM|nr:hypothetical protein [Thalassotalea eurytherma]GLX82484.1 hypothetical protein theurythT_19360 [Thalassotalea eurytherma]